MSTNPNILAQQANKEGEECYGHVAINIGNRTKETENVNETNPVPVEETDSAEMTEK